jgi:DnaJ-class molecular chaperone
MEEGDRGMRKGEGGMMERRGGAPVRAVIPGEEECEHCGGEGKILVRRAICTEALEETKICRRCGGGGQGLGRALSGGWRRILSRLRLR